MWVNAQFIELGIHCRIDTSECRHKFVSTCHLEFITIEIYFRTVSVEAEEKKGYVKSIVTLTSTIWDWHVQNVSAISCWIIMKIRFMEIWQYVCGIHGKN